MNLLDRFPRRVATALATAGILGLAALLQLTDANPAASQTAVFTAWDASSDPGLDPDAAEWQKARKIQVPLVAQAGAYIAGGGSVPVASAQALHYRERLYVRVEWDDATKDATTARVQDFADGVALEFPAKAATTVPSICMGQADRGVNIWHWRADSASGPTNISAAFENQLNDRAPVEFYTARDTGNPYAAVAASPVQNLVAQAFGTLSKSPLQDVDGNGTYRNGKWAVVFVRDLGAPAPNLAELTNGSSTDMAIAVWNGSEGDRNGKKSISQFVTLAIAGQEGEGINGWALLIGGVLLFGITGLGFALAAIGVSRKAR